MSNQLKFVLGLVVAVVVGAAIFCFLSQGCEKEAVAEPVVITYDDLMMQLTDASELHKSLPGERKLHASYDRTGGNNDYGFFTEKTPEGRLVIAELEGPGVIHRFWFTGYGKMKNFWFYFDGEEEPRMILQPPDISGDTAPFSIPLGQELSGAHFSYVPIPFRHSLRIVSDAKDTDRSYFQFTYSQYPEGSTVPQFAPSDPALLAAAAKINEGWENNSFSVPDAPQSWTGEIKSGGSSKLLEEQGDGIIKSFWLKLDFPPRTAVADQNAALRDMTLRIYWAGMEKPSVNVPLGDFFCNAWRKRRFVSAPLEYSNGRYQCRFPMPYKEGAVIEMVNDGTKAMHASAGFDLGELTYDVPLRYFHANWRFTDPASRPHPILSTKGKGHFLGCFLTVTGQQQSWLILEGDDQIWLDGEASPSLHGTGLEDYFNGGWYYNNLFAMPFHGLMERTPFRTSQYRFHGPDPIDFETSFRMQFEKGSQNDAAGFMTSVAYWYQDSPVAAPKVPPLTIRKSDKDPFGTHTFMVGCFELERLGHYDEAVEWCREFMEKHPGMLETIVAQLRSVAYAEKTHGFDKVKSAYEQFAKHPNPRIADAAGTLLRYGNDKDQALFGVHTAGSHEFYLDGKLLGRGKGPSEMQVYEANLLPGEHVLAAKAPFEMHESWFAMYLKSHSTNHYSDATWKCTYDASEGWQSPGYDDSGWGNASLKGRIPFLGIFYFIPNAFVDMQSPWNNIRPRDWNNVKRTAYFRKTITIPDGE